MELTAVFKRYETNSTGILEPIVAVRARSSGANRRDDGGKADDLVIEQEMQIPFAAIKSGGEISASFEERKKSNP